VDNSPSAEQGWKPRACLI